MKSIFFALSVACGIAGAAADPFADWEITPGPGMPSLESVGLSKEKLHKMSLEEIANPGTHIKARAISRIERSPILARYDITRNCHNDYPAEESCALWCILYLNGLGDTQCVADQGPPYWCTCHRTGSKGAIIYGVSDSPISYSCRYVADLMSWVPNNADCHYQGTCADLYKGCDWCGDGFECVGGFVHTREKTFFKIRQTFIGDVENCVEGRDSDKCLG